MIKVKFNTLICPNHSCGRFNHQNTVSYRQKQNRLEKYFQKSVYSRFLGSNHGRRQRGVRGCGPWIFILDTDKAERGLMVLLYGLVFSVDLHLLEIFLPTPLAVTNSIRYEHC